MVIPPCTNRPGSAVRRTTSPMETRYGYTKPRHLRGVEKQVTLILGCVGQSRICPTSISSYENNFQDTPFILKIFGVRTKIRQFCLIWLFVYQVINWSLKLY